MNAHNVNSSSSYYDQNARAAAALLRARQPYLIKNLLVGGSLFAMSIGICMSRRYSKRDCLGGRWLLSRKADSIIQIP